MVSPSQKSSNIIKLQPISAVSPSLAETLRNCSLQAAFSRFSELSEFVLGNPKAWLGIAYHEVMGKIWIPTKMEFTEDELIEHLWSNAICSIEQKAIDHPLNWRFSAPEKWPGYYLTRACVQMQVKQALTERPLESTSKESSTVMSNTIREQQQTAAGGKLVGKPDIIMDDEIRDYKSGKIYVETDEGRVIKEEYVRQLCLYGHLVHANYGKCPKKGRLLSMRGENIEIDLDPAMCTAEAEKAVRLLDLFNRHLAGASDVLDLATPSPNTCRWCQFKLVCNAFWKFAEESWIEEIHIGAVRGILDKPIEFIHDGIALAVSMNVNSGTFTHSSISMAPLDRSIHANISDCVVGNEIRIINLGIRLDRRPYPTIYTVCLREEECPIFQLPSSTVADNY